MLDAKQRSEIEQAIAGMSELVPELSWNLFSSLKAKGFTESQAMILTCQMLIAQFGKPPVIGGQP